MRKKVATPFQHFAFPTEIGQCFARPVCIEGRWSFRSTLWVCPQNNHVPFMPTSNPTNTKHSATMFLFYSSSPLLLSCYQPPPTLYSVFFTSSLSSSPYLHLPFSSLLFTSLHLLFTSSSPTFSLPPLHFLPRFSQDTNSKARHHKTPLVEYSQLDLESVDKRFSLFVTKNFLIVYKH